MRHRLAIAVLVALGLSLPLDRPAAAEGAGDAAYPLIEEADPLEGINRRVYGFNQALYSHLVDPVLTAYTTHVPTPLRVGVANLFSNLRHPISVANSALAGEWALSRHYFQRFTINATFGLLGIADVAAKTGIREIKPFGFADVLCAYDVPPGPYLVVPALGPTSLRTGIGHAVDVATAMVATGDFHDAYLIGVHFHEYEDARGDLKAVEGMALDPYAAVRSAVRQTEAICGPLP